MIKAEKAHITNLRADKARFDPVKWENRPASNYTVDLIARGLSKTETIVNDRVPTITDTIKYAPLICKRCGAPINRETMTCEYCGTQYGKG